MSDYTKTIELWPCRYYVSCKVRNCKAKATTIARSVDATSRPLRQCELCQLHAEQISAQEREKGREIVRCGVGQ